MVFTSEFLYYQRLYKIEEIPDEDYARRADGNEDAEKFRLDRFAEHYH